MTARLSLCCLTDAPGERIEAILAPLRDVADEVVIAADTRTDEADFEAYGRIADRVLRCEFDVLETHLAWLHEQCSGDWILRLDGDERVSPELASALPELIAAPNLRQYWLPRRWLDPTGRGWLDELPWSPDYQNRLVRNDSRLSFCGKLHSGAEPAFPAQYRSEPFDHELCALTTREERLEHSLLYEIRLPYRLAPGGGPFNATFYLPERFARRPPRPLSEPGFELAGPEAVRILEPDLRMYQGEVRGLIVRVRNDSEERWPGGLEQEPRIRLSYHWHSPDGAVLVHDGERSPLPAPLEPRETAIAPVTVVAPAEVGRYLLTVDLVHEDVRWLGCGVSAEVEVVVAGETARNVPRPRRFPKRRQLIPRAIHQVWLGPSELPEEYRAYASTWRDHHPTWEYRLWTDAEVEELALPSHVFERALSYSDVSDVVRYHVLARHGGVYVDTDFECLRSLEPLLGGIEAFAAFEHPSRVCNALIGAVAGHPAFRRAAELSLVTVGLAPSPSSAGPPFLTHLLWEFPEVTVFPTELFYPYSWEERHRPPERFGEQAYAVHHWAMSWSRGPSAAASGSRRHA